MRTSSNIIFGQLEKHAFWILALSIMSKVLQSASCKPNFLCLYTPTLYLVSSSNTSRTQQCGHDYMTYPEWTVALWSSYSRSSDTCKDEDCALLLDIHPVEQREPWIKSNIFSKWCICETWQTGWETWRWNRQSRQLVIHSRLHHGQLLGSRELVRYRTRRIRVLVSPRSTKFNQRWSRASTLLRSSNKIRDSLGITFEYAPATVASLGSPPQCLNNNIDG